MWKAVLVLIWGGAGTATADAIYMLRTARAGEVLQAQHLVVRGPDYPGAYQNLDHVVGQEAKVTLYAGQPLRRGEIGPPALVDRNALVQLVFENQGLRITSEGRSLSRGALGDRIRVMNLSSRSSLFGVVQADGTVEVGK